GYNPELHNKPFAAKRPEYLGSNIVMTRRLAEFETWGEEEMRRRGREMAEEAASIWPGPAAPTRRTGDETVAGKPSRSDLRLRFWTGFRDSVRASGSDLDLSEPATNYNLRCGRLGVGAALYAYLIQRTNRLAVSAYFYGKQARRAFLDLREHRDAIEAEV